MASHAQDTAPRPKPARAASATKGQIHATTAVLQKPEAPHVPGNLHARRLMATALLTTAVMAGCAIAAAVALGTPSLSTGQALASGAVAGVLGAAGMWCARQAWLLGRAQARAQRTQERIQRVIDGLSHGTLERASGLLLARWCAAGPDHLPTGGTWSFTLEWAVDKHGCTPHRIHLVPRRDTGAKATPSKRMAPPYPLTNPGLLHRHSGSHIPPAVAAPDVAAEDWAALPTGRRHRHNALRLRVRLHPVAFDTAHQRLALRAALHHAFPPFYDDATLPPQDGRAMPEAPSAHDDAPRPPSCGVQKGAPLPPNAQGAAA